MGMERKNKIRVYEWVFIILSWIILTNLYSWLIIANFEVLINATEIEKVIKANVIASYMYSGYQYLEATLFGLIFGLAFAFLEHITDSRIIRRHSFGQIIMIKSVFYVISIFFAFTVIYLVFYSFDLYPIDIFTSDFFSYLTFESVLSILMFILITILLMNFVLQVNRKFGPGNLVNMLLGKYATPKDEQRIFMFLDLNDSTTLAETLGHVKYSKLIQNCYRDLTNVVLKYNADIYQYVGDEVVLSWTITRGLYKSNCIKTFYAYEKVLMKKAEFYRDNFGIIPEFKAGMDMGTVTATEIGEIKREIAYHGDVLNTASRVQHMCKEMHQKLIVTEKVSNHLQLGNGFSKKNIGEVNLKGKRGVTGLYTITFSQQSL